MKKLKNQQKESTPKISESSMEKKKIFKNLPKSLYQEEKILISHGFNNWDSIIHLTDQEINKMVQGTLGSVKNFKKIRCMSVLILHLDLQLSEAALLMHSGLASIKSISSLTPQELLLRTGRFERLLRTGREPIVNLKIASKWILKAKKLVLIKT